MWYGVVERGLRAEVLGRLGWRLQAPSKSVCSILPHARHLRAGASYGVPALSFALETLKRVGRAPSTFGSRPSGGHISNVGGAPQPSLHVSTSPSMCRNNSFAVYARALLGSTIDSSLSRAPLIPPPRNSDPAFRFVSGRSPPVKPGPSYLCEPGARALWIFA
jgi:hypothetical protein